MALIRIKGRPRGGDKPLLKLLGRWGGFVNPKKLKVLGRRMIRRINKRVTTQDE